MSNGGWGPSDTPRVVKWVLLITLVISLLASLLNPAFLKVLAIPGPQNWLELSLEGLKHGFFWQPISYLFVQRNGEEGVGFFLLTSLAFDLYVLWIIGSMVQERVGSLRFLFLYLGAGAVAGLAAIAVAFFAKQGFILAGPTPSLLALFVCWVMYYPTSEMRLFFLIPLRTKWILATVVVFICLVTLLQLDEIAFTHYAVAMAFGYVFGRTVLGLKPF